MCWALPPRPRAWPPRLRSRGGRAGGAAWAAWWQRMSQSSAAAPSAAAPSSAGAAPGRASRGSRSTTRRLRICNHHPHRRGPGASSSPCQRFGAPWVASRTLCRPARRPPPPRAPTSPRAPGGPPRLTTRGRAAAAPWAAGPRRGWRTRRRGRAGSDPIGCPPPSRWWHTGKPACSSALTSWRSSPASPLSAWLCATSPSRVRSRPTPSRRAYAPAHRGRSS
mmetsp:Transcript_88862/g.287395  ORF Transcript_88862/g.287395 Transcript_88862/m.287395 type:complete len:222 (-) Transcript_88862:1571-2236(-)